MRFVFDIDPIGKPRMTQSDKWKKRDDPNPGRRARKPVVQYWDFKDRIRCQADKLGFVLPDAYVAVFYLPFPKSYSKKERERLRGQPHQLKPDKDNLEKALNDALRDHDEAIWSTTIEKRWADTGSIEVFVDEPPLTQP